MAITEKEAKILEYLTQNKKTVTRDEMLKDIWAYSGSADTKTVENPCIYRLRSKVHKTFAKEIIMTNASGYKLIEN